VICIGAAFVDEIFHMKEEMIIASTVPATVTKSVGGVSRNIAHQLALLGVDVQLVTVFGDDSDGDWLKEVSITSGVKIDASITNEGLSGKYTGILNLDGSLFTAFLTNATTVLITPQHLEQHKSLLQTASYLLADANISVSAGEWLLAFSKETGIPLILEPVSVPPARKFKNVDLSGLYLVTPNEDELPVLCSEKSFITQLQIEELLEKGIENIWLHHGEHGSALYSKERSITLHAPEIEIVDCTGAGDGSLTGFILGKTLGKNDLDCMRIAHTLSAEILQVNGAIAKDLDQQKLLNLVSKYYPD
jgi:pseudouridine kinase